MHKGGAPCISRLRGGTYFFWAVKRSVQEKLSDKDFRLESFSPPALRTTPRSARQTSAAVWSSRTLSRNGKFHYRCSRGYTGKALYQTRLLSFASQADLLFDEIVFALRVKTDLASLRPPVNPMSEQEAGIHAGGGFARNVTPDDRLSLTNIPRYRHNIPRHNNGRGLP